MLENMDNKSGGNETTFKGIVLQQNRCSQLIVTVRNDSGLMSGHGRVIVDGQGDASRRSLSDC
ncbi:hypothetical protein Pla52o_25530 [Novipirellula galeiformis]|uniref:Uncharacterized protein n=1 Tax=Novipirellula galeiformis TaxID=2528004 RepID=A0A5C6CJN3_9BACT|nr:hypothetical protein Pla52o_25530 [Novipirellula galeiformis]